jgi:hypothetical protein
MLLKVWILVKYSPKNASKANTTTARIANKTINIRFFTLFMLFPPFLFGFNTFDHGDSQQTAADKENCHPQCHMAVIACLRNSCSGVRIVFSRSTVVIGSFKPYLCAVGLVVFNACDNRIFNIFPLRCKRNALRNGLGEIVFGITVIPTLKRITRLSWCCGFGCLITPDNILTWYFTTAIAVKFYNARNVPPMI